MDDQKADKIIELLTQQNKIISQIGLLFSRVITWMITLAVISILVQIFFR